MSDDTRKMTRTISTTDRKGNPHTCTVYDFLMWSVKLRGINEERTVAIRRKYEFERRAARRAS